MSTGAEEDFTSSLGRSVFVLIIRFITVTPCSGLMIEPIARAAPPNSDPCFQIGETAWPGATGRRET
ncbi:MULTISPECIES: hypothetical protein [unclassified Shinella]|uniref:hypothetical protein n=1 Tax=unclassified Shinella TaxID=2643062 RepID=UPI003FA78E78